MQWIASWCLPNWSPSIGAKYSLWGTNVDYGRKGNEGNSSKVSYLDLS